MNLGLRGRVAIVTGGSKGIGKSIAAGLAREGARVAIVARGEKALSAARKEIEKAGGDIFPFSVNLTKRLQVQKMTAAIARRFGGIDILVNNAGGVETYGGFFDVDPRECERSFEGNVMSTVNSIAAAAPYLKKSKAGRIINVSSISGVEPGYFNPHYTAMKAAVINLSKQLANQLAREKILVNVVCPGSVETEAWDRNIAHVARAKNLSLERAKKEFFKVETAKIPLGKVGKADDVAGLVAFLASDLASWITGSCFHVDGGKLRSMS
jgi:NAD(P)-dependent dehydrogenase (short-subunit alcohol dehydrogenase family)